MRGDDMTQRLRDLAAQHRSGALTDQEYADAKHQLLGSADHTPAAQETLALPAVTPSSAQARTPAHRSLAKLIAAVAVVILILAVAIWLGSTTSLFSLR
jgi:hypothetical protein